MAERGPDVQVWCQVQIQRLDTPERTAFASQQHGGDDRPAAMSAAERGTVGRDRQLERIMLDQIAERLGRGTNTQPAPASQPRVP